jgi:Zn-dependent protease with chaperone function
MRARTSGRRVDTSAFVAFVPLLAIFPLWLLALAVMHVALRPVWDVPFVWFAVGYLACAVLLFVKPVQVLLLTRLLGARRPTRDEAARLDTAWRSVVEAAGAPPSRFVVAVLPADELNAFACGGHLVVVTSLAVETLPRDELAGVLAHEIGHHLGLHTVALTITQWLSVPIWLLARFGFFLQNVAAAATTSWATHSAALTALGRFVAAMLTAVSWVFLSGLLAANVLGNLTGTGAEFEADRRAVELGFGSELARALRRIVALGGGGRPRTWRERLAATHPPARTRIARIESSTRRDRAGEAPRNPVGS